MGSKWRILWFSLCLLVLGLEIPVFGFSILAGETSQTKIQNLQSKIPRPTYVVAFIPLNWSGDLDDFEAAARGQGEFFVAESGIEQYAKVEFKFIRERLDVDSLENVWLAYDVVAFGLTQEPADRYIALTDGDLAPGGDGGVVGWTLGPDALGAVVEAGDQMVTAHELGHTFSLCDEYFFPYWEGENDEWGCPNPFPPQCPQSAERFCDGLPAPNGRNSIMGPAGLLGGYAYNEPSLTHLHGVFADLFGQPAAPPGPTPTPTPTPPPLSQPLVVAAPELVWLEGGALRSLTGEPALHPAWSADGQWLAYAAWQAGNLDLFRLPAGGGAAARLTDSPAREWSPAWLPDGEQLLFVSDAAGAAALYRLALATGAAEPLAGLPAPAGWPAVSPDGRRLAFAAAATGDWELYLVELDDAGAPRPATLVRLIYSPGLDVTPAWDGDGRSLVFASDRAGSLDLYGLLVDDLITYSLSADPAAEWAPRWLADGRIVYHAYDGAGLGARWLDPQTGLWEPLAATATLGTAAWPVPQPAGE